MKPKTWILLCILVLVLISLASAYLVMRVNGKRTLSYGTVDHALFDTKTYTVEITQFGFVPSELEISQGESITWENKDYVPNTLVFLPLNMTKPVKILKNGNYTYTFDEEGVYEYSTQEYKYKKGKITVKKFVFR